MEGTVLSLGCAVSATKFGTPVMSQRIGRMGKWYAFQKRETLLFVTTGGESLSCQSQERFTARSSSTGYVSLSTMNCEKNKQASVQNVHVRNRFSHSDKSLKSVENTKSPLQ